jgi:hypothetical protein
MIKISSQSSLNSQPQSYHWLCQRKTVTIAYETLGQGSPVLLLPAFSTVSSRTELVDIFKNKKATLSEVPKIYKFVLLTLSVVYLRYF